MQLTSRAIAVGTRAAVVAALSLTVQMGVARAADADHPECSNHSLRGDYGFAIDGSILAGPAPVLLRGVAMTHFDGEGNLTQVDFTTRNGIPASPDWRPATGTYEVNADCTGKALIVPAVGPAIDLRLVVFDGGRQVATVVVGNASGSLGPRVR